MAPVMPGTETSGKAKPETVQEVAHHSPQRSCMKRRFGSGNSDGPVCQDFPLIPVRSAILNCPALYSYSRVCKYSFVSSHTESVFAWGLSLFLVYDRRWQAHHHFLPIRDQSRRGVARFNFILFHTSRWLEPLALSFACR